MSKEGLYWAMNNVESIFPYTYQSDGSCTLVIPSTDRTMLEDFSSIPDSINCAIFPKLINNELIRQFIYKRQLNIIMLKTTNVTCQRNLPNTTCPSTPSLDATQIDTRVLGAGNKNYSTYGTASENQMDFAVNY